MRLAPPNDNKPEPWLHPDVQQILPFRSLTPSGCFPVSKQAMFSN
jgi:hypothetical protein